jgi:hypothetical protein
MYERVARLKRKMEYEERRRTKNNIVIIGWRVEGKSKQQIKDERKVGNREDIHRQRPHKTRTRDTEETRNHRERRKKERQRSKSGI